MAGRRRQGRPLKLKHSETDILNGDEYDAGYDNASLSGYSNGSGYSSGSGYSKGSGYSNGSGYSKGSGYGNGLGYSNGSMYSRPRFMPNATSTPKKKMPLAMRRDMDNLGKLEKTTVDKREHEQLMEMLSNMYEDPDCECGLGTMEYSNHDGVLTRNQCHRLYGNRNASGLVDMESYREDYNRLHDIAHGSEYNEPPTDSYRSDRSTPSYMSDSMGGYEGEDDDSGSRSISSSGSGSSSGSNSGSLSISEIIRQQRSRNSVRSPFPRSDISGFLNGTSEIARRLSSFSGLNDDTNDSDDVSVSMPSYESLTPDSESCSGTPEDDSMSETPVSARRIRKTRGSDTVKLNELQLYAVVDGNKFFAISESMLSKRCGLIQMRTKK